MISVGFIILFGLTFVLFPCKGEIIPPPDATKLIFLNGSNATITWSFNDDISTVVSRVWYFTSSDGSFNAERLAIILLDQEPQIEKSGLTGVTIVKPATLILKNVNQTYNGTYRFALAATGSNADSSVGVFIAITPNITVYCSNLTILNASDYFACECKGQGGNPPADVTWYKGNEQNGQQKVTGKEGAILRLPNVTKDDNGTHTCVAKSHEEAKSTETIELIVNYPPENVTLTLKRNGGSVTITCTAEAHPAPSFEIFLNTATLVASDNVYNIPKVNTNDVGTYTCVASNILGNKTSNSEYLSFEVKPMNTNLTITPEKAEVGTSVSITCYSYGRPEPGYNITHIDTNMLRTGQTYIISDVKRSHAGTYTCIAWNKLGNDSDSANLTVEGKPVNTTIMIEPARVEVGKSVTIMWDSKGPPEPRYNITHNGTNVNVSTEKTYIISKAKWSDAGTYKCIAWNKHGNDFDSDNLTVFFEVEPRNTIITIEPSNVRLWGGPVTIKCDSEGIPEPTYTINHDGTMVSTRKKYTISTVELSDEGTYTCIATNKLGSDSASGDLAVAKWPIVLLVIGVVLLVIVIIAVVIYCYLKKKKRDGYKGNANVSPGASGALAVELDEEPAGGVDNAYDTVSNPGASGSKSKPPESTTPAVYAAVDKKNKEGKPLYATLDSLALEQVDNSKKKRDEERPGQSEYASIDFGKIGKVDEE